MMNCENVRVLCIKNNWFTVGTNKEFEKMFQLVKAKKPVEYVARQIYLNSDNVYYRDIVNKLESL
jgi:hypothetical protein